MGDSAQKRTKAKLEPNWYSLLRNTLFHHFPSLHIHATIAPVVNRRNRDMSDERVDHRTGGRFSRPEKLSIGIGRNNGGGGIIPTDPGDGTDAGAKFRDLVWVPDDEKVPNKPQKLQ